MKDAARHLPPPPTVDTTRPYTTVYTDGSSTGRVGPGGWAWVRTSDGDHASGGAHGTTNQRMELQAAHEAVAANPGLLLVVSDSEYVVKGATVWWQNWARARYHRVPNADLWEPFITDLVLRNGEVRFAWVKGHSGYEWNDRADELAKAARAQMTACPDCGEQMARATAILCGASTSEPLELPFVCHNPDCRADRDERALADAIHRGVISP